VSAIEVHHVEKRYGAVVALDDVNLGVEAGEVVAVLGPNGAGKSTLVSLLLGLRAPDRGAVRVLGGTPAAAAAAGRFGAMLQTGQLKENTTVERLVGLFAGLYPQPMPVREALGRAGVTDLARTKTNRLSGGQAQRVRFALAIVGKPELLFLDEPTSAMDIAARQAFWTSMREWADAGRTVLFSSHHLDEVEAVADRVIVLHRGRTVADAEPAALRRASGAATVRFELEHPRRQRLASLPGVTSAAVDGRKILLRTNDTDATIAAIYAAGLVPSGLAIEHTGLADVFLALTQASS
jgi:ABC-2 type transport system ATP-binding protein